MLNSKIINPLLQKVDNVVHDFKIPVSLDKNTGPIDHPGGSGDNINAIRQKINL
jgi:hypothetical protein